MRKPVPDPGVEFFISFHDLDPNAQKTCIYFIKQDRPDRRCTVDCSNNAQAIDLHHIITESAPEAILVDDIVQYILSNCCARARHRDLILSSSLLIPLVERWLDEILSRKRVDDDLRQSAQSPTPTTPRRTSRVDNSAPSSCSTSVSLATIETPLSSPSYSLSNSRAATTGTPFSSPLYNRPNSPKATIVSSLLLQPDASRTLLPRISSTITPSTISSESETSEAQKRYDLRPRAVHDALTQWSAQARLSLSAEFHPHIHKPTPEDTVAWRFCEALSTRNYKRDFETGSVYIYSRASSPGFVKIGWTSQSVDDRLAAWSKCGYTPIELFRVTGVPHAQRVETLTHHELIREWRREKPCKGCWERKRNHVRHQEWFEVSPERAIRVVSVWAEFLKKAEPYEMSGELGSGWRSVVDSMKVVGGAVTARRLLEHYEASVGRSTVLAEKAVIAAKVAIAK